MRIYSNPIFYRHHTGADHPEAPDRLDSAFEGVRRAGATQFLTEHVSETAEADRIIAKVHLPEYARHFEESCLGGYRFFHTYDNPISPESYAAARGAVETALTAAEDIWVRNEHNKAFVIARPPGHHAERDAAMGFCFFNTIACVAERLREIEGLGRVFILDWDVHHGNGTQSIFEERDDVFYASLHRFPFYPGTGAETEIGRGRGRGCTKNIPLDRGAGDKEYLLAFESVVMPLIDDFRPDAILVSAGFDAHVTDPIGGMHVSAAAFGEMTRLVVDAAERHCGGRLLSLLEGGYHPEGLASCIERHVRSLGMGD
jgi:acetoin utilization deacetylase AcuC-like enzyme